MNDLCYSRDDEDFSFTELGDLMQDLDNDGELEPGRVYYEADCTPITHEYIVSEHEITHLLENLDEQVYEEVGEISDCDYTGVSVEAANELRQLVKAWAEKHVALRYWRIDGKSRAKTFSKEEIEEYFA